METLYDCLKEAKLEKYYETFKANGVLQAESLPNLTMPEFCAMGISGSEDKRRLIKLIKVVKSVYRDVTYARSQECWQIKSSTCQALNYTDGGGGGLWEIMHIENKVPKPLDVATDLNYADVRRSFSNSRTELSRECNEIERGPTFCASSYLDMLELISEGSLSDAGDFARHSQDSDGSYHAKHLCPTRPINSNPISQKISTRKWKKHSSMKNDSNRAPNKTDNSPYSKQSRLGDKKEDKISVCVRKRPLIQWEHQHSDLDIITVNRSNELVLQEAKVAVDLTAYTVNHKFTFDEVFDENCTNEDVYLRAAKHLTARVFNRCNATIFTYGQTGAGKTHTMIGNRDEAGLYQLAAQEIYDMIASGCYGEDLCVWVSFFEIYCGQLFDLLNKRNRLIAREDGSQKVCIAGLTETPVTNVDMLINVMNVGNTRRSRGSSGLNPDSSRSHAVLQLDIRRQHHDRLGKLSFVDLAGSDRACDMGDANRQTKMEGAEINQSLLALKECIRSIDQENRHTPFRQSKLTHILKDAFVGNSWTCMIANLSPTRSAYEHTLNTLRYADRVKELSSRKGIRIRKTGGFGQVMNLLMNTPITGPPILLPSSALSTSTPAKRATSKQHRLRSPCHDVPEAYDTPMRGLYTLSKLTNHNPVPKENVDKKAAITRRGALLKCRQRAVLFDMPVPVGSSPSCLEQSSPSDSSDSDFNNITTPSDYNLALGASTSTDLGFKSPDFNNIEEDVDDLSRNRNDLNKSCKISDRKKNCIFHENLTLFTPQIEMANNLPIEDSSEHGRLSSNICALIPIMKGNVNTESCNNLQQANNPQVASSIGGSRSPIFGSSIAFTFSPDIAINQGVIVSGDHGLCDATRTVKMFRPISFEKMTHNCDNEPVHILQGEDCCVDFIQPSGVKVSGPSDLFSCKWVLPSPTKDGNTKTCTGYPAHIVTSPSSPSPSLVATCDCVDRRQLRPADGHRTSRNTFSEERYSSNCDTESGCGHNAGSSLHFSDDVSTGANQRASAGCQQVVPPLLSGTLTPVHCDWCERLKTDASNGHLPPLRTETEPSAQTECTHSPHPLHIDDMSPNLHGSGAVGENLLLGCLYKAQSSLSAEVFVPSATGSEPFPSTSPTDIPSASTPCKPKVNEMRMLENETRNEARVAFFACHEDHLVRITTLCKQEMKLLLSMKTSDPNVFHEYLSRVSAVLGHKMSDIEQLQQRIHEYRKRFSGKPHSR